MSNASNIARAWVALLLALALLPAFASGCSADCGWTTKAQAFVDDNHNGRWDQGESPLSGVKFRVVDAQGNSDYGGGWESDDSGNAPIAFFVSCNRSTEFVLFATPPEGFVLTTAEWVDAGSESGKTFAFGFAKGK
jgi:hypothetical protein